MHFAVLPVGARPYSGARSQAFLLADNWNDWFKYQTLYSLIYFDRSGTRRDIGGVKIGQFGMGENQSRPNIPEEFDELGEEFFSLGQDDSYYENLNELGGDVRNEILNALRDVAAHPELFKLALEEDVTGESLLRYVTRSTVLGQFGRMAKGGIRLSPYNFKYIAPAPSRPKIPRATLAFNVRPGSEPPTNIHVLIGRNGVGKTTLLDNMARALVDERAEAEKVGEFEEERDFIWDGDGLFANLVSVTFSAFDPFEPLSSPRNKSTGLNYAYIGLKRIRTTANKRPLPPKTPSRLAREFSDSVKACIHGARFPRWRRALEMLEADPIFKDAEVALLANSESDNEALKSAASGLFGRLSSGHKIVLLTITRLVETVEERSLVLLDEPEAHLHPPLLSAFIRALSDLLIDRNGVAIIATHSPVVLQEVPKSCVSIIRRNGRHLSVERPEIETFGENVGILTREVFGLEVTQSGFHRIVQDSIGADTTYDDVIDRFDGELGGEAKAIAKGLIAARENGES